MGVFSVPDEKIVRALFGAKSPYDRELTDGYVNRLVTLAHNLPTFSNAPATSDGSTLLEASECLLVNGRAQFRSIALDFDLGGFQTVG
jgi:hypothetical protein